MKLIIKLSAITLLAAFALVGCNQSATTPMDASTNSSTNTPPPASTNMPASTNTPPAASTNVPASTNQ